MTLGAVIRLLAAAVLALFAGACSQSKITEASLPANERRGLESYGFTISTTSGNGRTSAIGQIFSPPAGHLVLNNVSFWGTRTAQRDAGGPIRLRLRVSEWIGDRPATAALWESELQSIPEGFGQGWISFDVPEVVLKPQRRYIAWLSAAGLETWENDALSIKAMGPRTRDPMPKPESGVEWKPRWNYDYAEGARARWQGRAFGASIGEIVESPWIVDELGHNLHFKMRFASRAR